MDNHDDLLSRIPDDRSARQRRAEMIVKRKLEFIRHFIIYVITIVVVYFINKSTWFGYQWWKWVALGWGIGVVAHFFEAFLFTNGNLFDKMVNRELDRMD